MSIARPTTPAATEIQARVRRRPDPSQRDLQIYLDYQIAGKRQIDLAHDHKLTQCRISQIIRRVDAWRNESRIENQKSKIENESSPDSQPPTPDPLAFDFLLQSARLNLVCREAIRHFQHPQATVTHKKGARSDKQIDETTSRHHPANLQCLKIILQANSQHQRLTASRGRKAPGHSTPSKHLESDSSREPRTPSPEPPSSLSRESVETWLANQLGVAQQDGQVSFHADSSVIIHDLVSHLLGEPTAGLALDALAEQAGKKVVDQRSYEQSPPQVPPVNGWYYAMHDANGCLVTWLHASLFSQHIPADHEPAIACKGGLTLPDDHVLKAEIPPDYPPLSRDTGNPPPETAPAPAHNPPASESAFRNPQSTITPASTSSICAASADSPQTPSAPALTTHSPPIKISLPLITQSPAIPTAGPSSNVAGLEFS